MKSSPGLKKLLRINSFRVGLILTLIMTYITFRQPGFMEQIEAKAYDLRFRARGEQKGTDKIVVVAIDEHSIEKLGRWPWPRIYWAQFLKNLTSYNPRVITMDVIFSEPDQNLNLQILKELKQIYQNQNLKSLIEKTSSALKLIEDQQNLLDKKINQLRKSQKKSSSSQEKKYLQNQIQILKSQKSNLEELKIQLQTIFTEKQDHFLQTISAMEKQANTDQIFAQALDEVDNEVLGWFFFRYPREAQLLTPEENLRRLELVKPFSIKVIKYLFGATPEMLSRVVHPIYGFQVNLPIFSERTSGAGFFTAVSDPDGIYRHSLLVAGYPPPKNFNSGDDYYLFPSLSLETLRLYLNQEPVVVVNKINPTQGMIEKIQLGKYNIPVDEFGRMLINYQGGYGYFPTYSFYEIYSDFAEKRKKGFNPEQVFKDKIVLVGATAIAIYDVRTTPFGSMPGVYMHANVIDNVLQQRALFRPSWMRAFDLMVVLALGIIISLLYPRLRPIFSAGLVAILVAGYLWFNFYMFDQLHYSLTLSYQILSIFFIYLGITLYHYTMEEREKRFIRSAFSYYLSQEVIDQLLAHPEKLKLGGERKYMTIFFSDLQGFTSISEKMEPEELVSLLNHYLTEMSEIILKNRGTIDKFEGDAIMAFFGAPLDYPDHSQSACLTALEMQTRLQELNQQWRKQGLPQLTVRIGLNTGYALVGNMGSEKRMDYTVIGDEVNLASRLEGANKIYGTKIMLSESTYQKAKEVIEARELDLIQVVGKEKPVRVYELWAKKGELTPEQIRLRDTFHQALELYRKRDFIQAKEKFEQCLKIEPEDHPSKVFIERCQQYLISPLPMDWDGVYRLTRK